MAALERRRDCVGGARRCATVVVLRLLEWRAHVRDSGGAACDVASVVSESEEIYQNCNIYIFVHCIYYDLHYFI